MEKVKDKALLDYYIKKYEIHKVFEKDMEPYMQLLRFERNECICKTREEMPYLFFHVEGKLKIYSLLENGKTLLLRFNKPLNVLGDVELLKEHRATCNVDALCESLLIGIKMADLCKYAYDDPVFLRHMMLNLSHKLQTISNAAAINLLCPLENRFACYLLSTAMLEEEGFSKTEEIQTSKLTELATLLGTSYRHLNRIINDLCDRKIIKKEGRRIRILDESRLKELAGDNLYE